MGADGASCWRNKEPPQRLVVTDFSALSQLLFTPLDAVHGAGLSHSSTMADIYQFPVYFECHQLDKKEQKKVEIHFQNRRKAGGGECGTLSRVEGKIYRIAFRDHEVQQTVLQRSRHVVDLPDGPLELTVRESLDAHASSDDNTPDAPAESTQSTPASTPLPSSEECELQVDNEPLHDSECPEAEEEREEELSSVACSAQLYPEEGRASFRRSAQPGDEDEGSDWKLEEDNSCDRMQGRNEVESHSFGQSLSETATTVASYSLQDGLQVLVCDGDITKQNVDALVNAANEDLDHCGGVAAALSKAGGPEVQKESSSLVECIGKIPTGNVVLTSGGNLNCKALLHAVGPVGGEAGGRERILLEQTVQNALKLTEMMEFQSIAIPCISSGVFGVPVTVCCEAIVTAVKKFGSQGGRSLNKIILIDKRAEVVRAMKEACDRLLQGVSSRNSTGLDVEVQMGAAGRDSASGATAAAPGGSVHVEIVQGAIETQQVDALVSPMVGYDPLSTRVGNILDKTFGSKLTARFREEAGDEMLPSDAVLVEGWPGHVSDAVFFLSLAPWDDDQDGTAVEVLRAGINNILTLCDRRGFGSVAFPAVGVGVALRFPPSVVAKVLLEQIHAFERDRTSSTPLLVRIVIYPSDKECSEAFNSAQEDLKCKEFTEAQYQASTTKRIILLGKTGSGKSNLANTIFGETLFGVNHTPNSGTGQCQAETRDVNDRSITLIDTPGFFDTGKPEEKLKDEIVRCITECAPGPHAFLIVLKVEKFCEHEQAVISKIRQYFSDDALNYAVIVFTHGDQLPKSKKIEDFVSENKNLSDLVEKCGGRCHVFDNKHWNNKQQNNYRSNQFQVEELLRTIDEMVASKNGGYYTNKMLQDVKEQIQKYEEHFRQKLGDLPPEEIRKKAKDEVYNRFLIKLAGIGTGVLLGALCGVAAMVGVIIMVIQNQKVMTLLRKLPALLGSSAPAAAAAGGGEVALVAGAAVGGVVATAGGVMGGMIGSQASEGAETPMEAAEKTYEAVRDTAMSIYKKEDKIVLFDEGVNSSTSSSSVMK